MIKRFQGEGGQTALITALRAQRIVGNNETLAREIIKVAELKQIEPDSPDCEFIKQGAVDHDLYLILAGKVSIRVNGREVAIRTGGFHVGEMAMIDPDVRRSASVAAVEQTVVARISEERFSGLANRFPQLWRHLALELAERLRQRGRFVSSPNPQPVVFIASSAENLPVATELQLAFSHNRILASVWTDGVFRVSKISVESLLSVVRASDFAVLIAGPEDVIVSRDDEAQAPRDNVVFELGLFMGLLGQQRTFVVKSGEAKIKMPSDLLGFTPLEYADGPINTLTARVAPVCAQISKIISELGPA